MPHNTLPWSPFRRVAILMSPIALLTPTVAVASPGVALNNTSVDEHRPQISCAKPYAPTRPCLIVYEYDHAAGDVDLRAHRLQVDGTVVPGPILGPSTTYDDETHPALASMSDADTYLLVWEHQAPGGQAEIRARRLDNDGLPKGGSFTVASSATHERRPAVACAIDECLVIWEHEYAPGDIDVRGRRFDNGGSPIGAEFPIATTTTNETRPALDALGGEGPAAYYVAWEHEAGAGNRDIATSFVTGGSAAAVHMVASTAIDQTNPIVACRFGQTCLVAHEHEYAPGDRDIHGVLLDNLPTPAAPGVVPTTNPLVLANSTVDEHGPAIDRDAIFDHRYTLVWEVDPSASTREVVAQRYEVHDGTALGGFVIPQTQGSSADLRRPAIAGSEWDDYVIAWQERGVGSSLDIAAVPISFP